MTLKTMAAGFALGFVILTGVLVNTPDCIAGGAQYSPGPAQYSSLSISPFKGPPTAPVVITVFSDFQ
jgi:protein-disulfide isomerase